MNARDSPSLPLCACRARPRGHSGLGFRRTPHAAPPRQVGPPTARARRPAPRPPRALERHAEERHLAPGRPLRSDPGDALPGDPRHAVPVRRDLVPPLLLRGLRRDVRHGGRRVARADVRRSLDGRRRAREARAGDAGLRDLDPALLPRHACDPDPRGLLGARRDRARTCRPRCSRCRSICRASS